MTDRLPIEAQARSRLVDTDEQPTVLDRLAKARERLSPPASTAIDAAILSLAAIAEQMLDQPAQDIWWPIDKAAAEQRVCKDTMLARVRAHGIGRKNDGRWEVEMNRARAWRRGDPYGRLPAEP